jgi:hypothetical protein
MNIPNHGQRRRWILKHYGRGPRKKPPDKPPPPLGRKKTLTVDKVHRIVPLHPLREGRYNDAAGRSPTRYAPAGPQHPSLRGAHAATTTFPIPTGKKPPPAALHPMVTFLSSALTLRICTHLDVFLFSSCGSQSFSITLKLFIHHTSLILYSMAQSHSFY